MRKLQLLAVLLSAFAASLFIASPAQAQATRTWVSGVGDDANPCSRTAPCKTFAGAISKTATNGEIDALDPGGFGAVTITKGITIDGGGGQVASVLVAGTNGIVVSAPSTDNVTLRNIRINGVGQGLSAIRFIGGNSLHVENCYIFGFLNFGIDAETGNSSKLFVNNTVIQETAGGGILVKPTTGIATNATIDSVTIANSLFGVTVNDGVSAVLRNSVVTGNNNGGVFSTSTSAGIVLNVENTTVANNAGNGITSSGGGSTVRISNDDVFGNSGTGLNATGGSIISFGNNRVAGNGAPGAPTSTPGQL